MKKILWLIPLIFLLFLSSCVTVSKSTYKWEPDVIAAEGSINASVLVEAKHVMAPEVVQVWIDWMNTEQNIENWKAVLQDVSIEDMTKSGIFRKVVTSGEEGYQFIVRINTRESKKQQFQLDVTTSVIDPATMQTVLSYEDKVELGDDMFAFSGNLQKGLAKQLAVHRARMLSDLSGQNATRFSFLNAPTEYHAAANYKPSQVVVRDTKQPVITVVNPKATRGIVLLPREGVKLIGLVADESPILAVLINDVEAELNPIQGGVNFIHYVRPESVQKNITIKAIDQYGNIALRELSVQGKQEVQSQKPVISGMKPNLWILAIGISEYQDANLNLKYADNDARAVAEMMKKQEGKLYEEVNYQLLLNEKGTRENILNAIGKYLGMASYDDLVLIFMAGHGVKDKQTGSYYFLPYDATPDTLMTRGLLWSTFDEAQKRLSSNVSKVMLWLDTCHAGAMKVAMRGAEAGEELSQELRSGEGTFIIAASKPGEESEESKDFRLEGEKNGHGAFTYALLDGLTHKADMDNDSAVTISELSSYVAKRVPRITKGRQHPYFRLSGTDVPISMK